MRKAKIRLQFDFSNQAVNRLDGLVDITDSASRAEVIRNALRVYEYLIKKNQDGYDIELLERGGKSKQALLSLY